MGAATPPPPRCQRSCQSRGKAQSPTVGAAKLPNLWGTQPPMQKRKQRAKSIGRGRSPPSPPRDWQSHPRSSGRPKPARRAARPPQFWERGRPSEDERSLPLGGEASHCRTGEARPRGLAKPAPTPGGQADSVEGGSLLVLK